MCSSEPIRPARGIITGLRYSLALWSLAFLAWMVLCAFQSGMDGSKRIAERGQENFSSYRTANGGVR